MVGVPVQNNFNFNIGVSDRTQYGMNIQPVIPGASVTIGTSSRGSLLRLSTSHLRELLMLPFARASTDSAI
jgi:hypothetical protein